VAEKKLKMIVGLGNPGDKYKNTRHNAGFMVVGLFAEKLGLAEARTSWPNLLAWGKTEGQKVLLVWPQTFMNNSGPAVKRVLDYYKISPSDLLVVHDEMDLPVGRLKFSRGGGYAGHRGVQSILEEIPQDFDRLRFGVGRPTKGDHFKEKSMDYVLSPFSSLESQAVDETLNKAAGLIEVWAVRNLAAAQRLGNRSEKPPKPEKEALTADEDLKPEAAGEAKAKKEPKNALAQ
jgi:PTH1 family peptidyl-tRNA hydrolase